MLVGHLGVGLIGKRIEPKISLGTWLLAVLLADLICFPLLIAGIEQFHLEPGATLNRSIGRIPYSHSLLMDTVWAGLFAAAYFMRRHYPRGAWLLFGGVLSHWLLDAVSHRPDMQIAPGVPMAIGWGLWNSIPATLVVEGGLWLSGIAVYVRATHAKGRAGVYAFWAGIVLLTLAWWGNIHRGVDPDPVRAGIGGLIFFSLMVAWAYWMNPVRPVSLVPRAA